MSPEVVDQAIDWLGRCGSRESVLSFYGGEPFLERPLLAQAAGRARNRLNGQALRLNTPTNALLLDEQALNFARRERLELTISIDGTTGPGDRRDVSGNDATQALLQRLPSIFALQPDCQLLARMTVTPTNVSDLCTHVRSLYAIGFHRIVYQPAYEAGWTARSIDLYAREHSRIGTWLLGLRSLGKPQPEVQPWRSIVQRLRSDTRRSHCGAGINVLAVAPDGALYPCYRFATERGGEDYRLGDVGRGVTEAVRVEEFATLEPDRLQPQGVSCTDCSARDGCGHFCPATGVLLGEGLNSVPAVVCELIRAQVAAVRPYVELTARRPRTCGPATSTVVESMES